jgi:hypothetical protein
VYINVGYDWRHCIGYGDSCRLMSQCCLSAFGHSAVEGTTLYCNPPRFLPFLHAVSEFDELHHFSMSEEEHLLQFVVGANRQLQRQDSFLSQSNLSITAAVSMRVHACADGMGMGLHGTGGCCEEKRSSEAVQSARKGRFGCRLDRKSVRCRIHTTTMSLHGCLCRWCTRPSACEMTNRRLTSPSGLGVRTADWLGGRGRSDLITNESIAKGASLFTNSTGPAGTE